MPTKFVARSLQTLTAWKYEAGADVPIWVARRCHGLGDGKLTANTIVGAMPVNVGDYVGLVDEELGAVAVVGAAQFEAEYAPAGEPAKTPNGRTVDDAIGEAERILYEMLDDLDVEKGHDWFIVRLTEIRDALADRPR